MLIEPELMVIAENVAKKSPCLRRKYGAVLTDALGITIVATPNSRIGRCCGGGLCVRDRFDTRHAERVELGAEIHAEQAALISWRGGYTGLHLYLAGYGRDGNLLKGAQCRPCHMCAMMIKFAGINHVIIRDYDDNLIPVSVSEIIEEHERAWSESIYVA